MSACCQEFHFGQCPQKVCGSTADCKKYAAKLPIGKKYVSQLVIERAYYGRCLNKHSLSVCLNPQTVHCSMFISVIKNPYNRKYLDVFIRNCELQLILKTGLDLCCSQMLTLTVSMEERGWNSQYRKCSNSELK